PNTTSTAGGAKQWGDRDNKPGEFNLPHTIAADAKGNIYVGDRSNRRIQVFDPDGKFQREITIDIPVPPGVQPWMSPMSSAEAAARQSWRPVGDLHHAWSHTISIQCRWISRPDLQAFPGWQSARSARHNRAGVEGVRMDS